MVIDNQSPSGFGAEPEPSDTQLASHAPNPSFDISPQNQHYINVMRGISIIRVVLAHLGLSWFFLPYSQYIGILFPVLFFVSGAVSFYSFSRASGTIEYLIKRLVLVLTPFYLFSAVIVILGVAFYSLRPSGLVEVLRWILVWPDQSKVFFPFGQIWFINALALMILVSTPLFAAAMRRPWLLFVAGIGPFSLSIANSFFPAYEYFTGLSVFRSVGFGWQAWQTATLLGMFLFGAGHYRLFQNQRIWVSALIAIACFLLATILFLLAGGDFELREHIKTRSVYFMLLSFFAIYSLIALRPVVLLILDRIPPLNWLVLYSNRYAYAIFLLHTLVLFGFERYAGMSDLGGRPLIAILRMLLVFAVTLVLAKPIGELSNRIAKAIRRRILSRVVNSQP